MNNSKRNIINQLKTSYIVDTKSQKFTKNKLLISNALCNFVPLCHCGILSMDHLFAQLFSFRTFALLTSSDNFRHRYYTINFL